MSLKFLKLCEDIAAEDGDMEENAFRLTGGVADGMTVKDLADKFDVSEDEIEEVVNQGIDVEMEHTDDEDIAKQIAMDHIFELGLRYYDELADMEDKLKSEMGEEPQEDKEEEELEAEELEEPFDEPVEPEEEMEEEE